MTPLLYFCDNARQGHVGMYFYVKKVWTLCTYHWYNHEVPFFIPL